MITSLILCLAFTQSTKGVAQPLTIPVSELKKKSRFVRTLRDAKGTAFQVYIYCKKETVEVQTMGGGGLNPGDKLHTGIYHAVLAKSVATAGQVQTVGLFDPAYGNDSEGSFAKWSRVDVKRPGVANQPDILVVAPYAGGQSNGVDIRIFMIEAEKLVPIKFIIPNQPPPFLVTPTWDLRPAGPMRFQTGYHNNGDDNFGHNYLLWKFEPKQRAMVFQSRVVRRDMSGTWPVIPPEKAAVKPPPSPPSLTTALSLIRKLRPGTTYGEFKGLAPPGTRFPLARLRQDDGVQGLQIMLDGPVIGYVTTFPKQLRSHKSFMDALEGERSDGSEDYRSQDKKWVKALRMSDPLHRVQLCLALKHTKDKAAGAAQIESISKVMGKPKTRAFSDYDEQAEFGDAGGWNAEWTLPGGLTLSYWETTHAESMTWKGWGRLPVLYVQMSD